MMNCSLPYRQILRVVDKIVALKEQLNVQDRAHRGSSKRSLPSSKSCEAGTVDAQIEHVEPEHEGIAALPVMTAGFRH